MNGPKKLKQFGGWLYRIWDTKIHFLHLHYFYIFFLIFLFSGLYYCEPGTDWKYIDALFMATTGSTDTGLNTIPMSEMSTYHMILLYLSSFLGCHVIISFFVVMVRRYYFSRRFEEELKENQRRREEYRRQKLARQGGGNPDSAADGHTITGPIRRRLSLLSVRSANNNKQTSLFSKRKNSFDTHATRTTDDIVVHHTLHNMISNDSDSDKDYSSIQIESNDGDTSEQQQQSTNQSTHPFDTTPNDNSNDSITCASYPQDSNKTISFSDNLTSNNPNQQITFREDTNILRERERKKLLKNRNNDDTEQIPLQRTNSEYEIMSRPTAKSELTKHERYRIGGTEYRALEMLARIVPIYYIGFIISFGFFFRIYVAASTYAQEVLATSNPNGPVDPWFFSMFMSLSSFTNLGLNHLDASMTPFQNAPAPLILSIILILVGNTAFAILLRFIIWLLYILTPKTAVMRRETFRYLLDHPRRCYTTLFPATQTWWLLIVLIAITLVELICFLALNYWLPVLADISWGSRFLDGLFQSVATRNGIYFTHVWVCVCMCYNMSHFHFLL